MKRLIQLKLKILAKIILAKYRPEVVGVTGSVGKTSAKEAIWTVLSLKFNVRKSVKNYNNEIGLPLTIIGVDSPGSSIIGWCAVFLHALKLILIKDKSYPKILVLEMGVDKPGDMAYLNSIAKCRVGVITAIGPAHLEFFKNINSIQKEKIEMIKNLNQNCWAILNCDDERVMQAEKDAKAKILTYGFNNKADIRASEAAFSFKNNSDSSKPFELNFKNTDINNLSGVSFKLIYNGSAIPVLLLNTAGNAIVYSALAGVAAGIAFGLNLVEISKALREFKPPRGRMNLISGIKNTLIIDDTYNSSPQSSSSALDVVSKIPLQEGARRFAILGDMLELGSVSEISHRQIGKQSADSKIDKLILVGERSRDIARGAEDAGMFRDNIFHFAKAEQAGKFAQERISEGDLILVKGSQGVRMEKIVKEIMAEPLRAKELLVRQGSGWEG